ncbi:MAG: hypothetical protein RJA44_2107 [Pseudomonadota bacterium]
MNTPSTSRRRLLLGGAAALLAPLARAATPLVPAPPLVEVWKSPTCGCCQDWIRHLEANGMRCKVYDEGNTDARARFGLPLRYGSCHTALIGGYVIEGHVPAREIQRLLREKPQALGLAVPAMPVGSPGMDGPEYQGRKDPYDVLLIAENGSARVYQSYR